MLTPISEASDIIEFDSNDKPIEVVAVKSFSIDVTTGKGCRNTKGRKHVVSIAPYRDTKAEVGAARKFGLNKIRRARYVGIQI